MGHGVSKTQVKPDDRQNAEIKSNKTRESLESKKPQGLEVNSGGKQPSRPRPTQPPTPKKRPTTQPPRGTAVKPPAPQQNRKPNPPNHQAKDGNKKPKLAMTAMSPVGSDSDEENAIFRDNKLLRGSLKSGGGQEVHATRRGKQRRTGASKRRARASQKGRQETETRSSSDSSDTPKLAKQYHYPPHPDHSKDPHQITRSSSEEEDDSILEEFAVPRTISSAGTRRGSKKMAKRTKHGAQVPLVDENPCNISSDSDLQPDAAQNALTKVGNKNLLEAEQGTLGPRNPSAQKLAPIKHKRQTKTKKRASQTQPPKPKGSKAGEKRALARASAAEKPSKGSPPNQLGKRGVAPPKPKPAAAKPGQHNKPSPHGKPFPPGKKPPLPSKPRPPTSQNKDFSPAKVKPDPSQYTSNKTVSAQSSNSSSQDQSRQTEAPEDWLMGSKGVDEVTKVDVDDSDSYSNDESDENEDEDVTDWLMDSLKNQEPLVTEMVEDSDDEYSDKGSAEKEEDEPVYDWIMGTQGAEETGSATQNKDRKSLGLSVPNVQTSGGKASGVQQTSGYVSFSDSEDEGALVSLADGKKEKQASAPSQNENIDTSNTTIKQSSGYQSFSDSEDESPTFTAKDIAAVLQQPPKEKHQTQNQNQNQHQNDQVNGLNPSIKATSGYQSFSDSDNEAPAFSKKDITAVLGSQRVQERMNTDAAVCGVTSGYVSFSDSEEEEPAFSATEIKAVLHKVSDEKVSDAGLRNSPQQPKTPKELHADGSNAIATAGYVSFSDSDDEDIKVQIPKFNIIKKDPINVNDAASDEILHKDREHLDSAAMPKNTDMIVDGTRTLSPKSSYMSSDDEVGGSSHYDWLASMDTAEGLKNYHEQKAEDDAKKAEKGGKTGKVDITAKGSKPGAKLAVQTQTPALPPGLAGGPRPGVFVRHHSPRGVPVQPPPGHLPSSRGPGNAGPRGAPKPLPGTARGPPPHLHGSPPQPHPGVLVSQTLPGQHIKPSSLGTSHLRSPKASAGGRGPPVSGPPSAAGQPFVTHPLQQQSEAAPHVKETTAVKREKAALPETSFEVVKGSWLTSRFMVNNYIVLNSLGTGTFAEVRLAKEKKSNVLYAIKIIKKANMSKKILGKSNTNMDDIKREIAIMKKLNHPNVLRLYEVMDDPKVKKMYLVIEYASKGDLMHMVQGNDNNQTCQPLAERHLQRLLRQICEGLNYLHSQEPSIVHGDIKPHNILMDANFNVKIADFGISKMVTVSKANLEESGGTPAFMSPELCGGDAYDGARADVWALGATVYLLAIGNLPFQAKQMLQLYHKIINDPLVFPETPKLDPSLQNLVTGMLIKNPADRLTLKRVMEHPWLLSKQYHQEAFAFRKITGSQKVSVTEEEVQSGIAKLKGKQSTNITGESEDNMGQLSVVEEEEEQDTSGKAHPRHLVAGNVSHNSSYGSVQRSSRGNRSHNSSYDSIRRMSSDRQSTSSNLSRHTEMDEEEATSRMQKLQLKNQNAKSMRNSNVSLASVDTLGDDEFLDDDHDEDSDLFGTMELANKTRARGAKRLNSNDLSSVMDTLMQQPNELEKKKLKKAYFGNRARHVKFGRNLLPKGNLKRPEFHISAAWHQHKGPRLVQEDRVQVVLDLAAHPATSHVERSYLLRPYAYFALFDGHGGFTTSQYLHDHLLECLIAQPTFFSKLQTALDLAAIQVDTELCENLLKKQSDESGSTGNLIVYDHRLKTLTIANVGDSRCVLSIDGNAHDLSQDHRLTRADERRRCEQAGAPIIKDRVHGMLAISRTFGDQMYKDQGPRDSIVIATPEIQTQTITKESEFMVIASDGIWDVLESQEVVNFIRLHLKQHRNLQQVCEELISEALDLGSVDNCSVIIVAFNQH